MIMSGEKKAFKLSEIRTVKVPRLPEFSVDKLYKMALTDPNTRSYLPEPATDHSRPINRKFLFEVILHQLTNHSSTLDYQHHKS